MLPFPIISNTNILPELKIKGNLESVLNYTSSVTFVRGVSSSSGDIMYFSTPNGDLYAFDQVNNTYTQTPSTGYGITEPGIAMTNGFVWRMAGRSITNGESRSDTFKYTISTNTSTKVSNINTGGYHVTACADSTSNNYVYALNNGTLYRYIISTNTWSILLNTGLSTSTNEWCQMVYYNSKILMIARNILAEYDPLTNTIQTVKYPEFPGYSTNFVFDYYMCIYKDSLYVMSKFSDGNASTQKFSLYELDLNNYQSWRLIKEGTFPGIFETGYGCMVSGIDGLYYSAPTSKTTGSLYKIT